MTPPNVIFVPAPTGGAVNWDISGTFDLTTGNGTADADPVFTTPTSAFSGLLYIGVRQDSNIGLFFNFDNNTNRNAFVSAYPDNFAQVTYEDSINNTQVVTSSGWVWDTSTSGRAYLRTTQWTNWQTVSTSHTGATYTLSA